LHIPCPPENASHKCKDANDPGHLFIAINLVFDNDKALVHYRHKSLKNLPHRNDTVFCGILAFPHPRLVNSFPASLQEARSSCCPSEGKNALALQLQKWKLKEGKSLHCMKVAPFSRPAVVRTSPPALVHGE
jgi:hypothetical protein